ncbi:restriction endonuclease subunit S [Parvularcula sp. IMCC14364]|uniref:restriction endonuclease subunit S n=1 Tax=Parvularcula sp. IMCC14364 TaxID=3067902 RepID=UPI00274200BD|nr:restriction endonuclease subunit S [Parvularcula sp. IMCC14364]
MYRPDFEGHCSSEIFPMLPDECLDRGYLFHWITSDQVVEKINATSTGARMPRANVKEILQFPIPLPPLEEQQRIVAVLDEAFEGLARARAHAEANLQNARELFESAVEAALERAGGEPVSLQEMMDTGMITSHLDGNHGSDYPRKAEFVSEGVPYISANCIADNEIDFGRCKYLTLERASGLRKGVAKNRDVLFAHNATVGPVTLLKTEEEKVILSTSLTYYRCNESELIPEFLVCEMRSAGFRRQYEAVMAQATRNQVPITMQRKFTHLIPPIAEQRRIAELGVELEAKCNSAEKAYEASLKDLDDLRQSLLQKAFAGELT